MNKRKGYDSSLFGAETKENNIDIENLSSCSDNTKETTKKISSQMLPLLTKPTLTTYKENIFRFFLQLSEVWRSTYKV